MKNTKREYRYPMKWRIFSVAAVVLTCMLLYMDLHRDYGLVDRIRDFVYYGIGGISYEIRTPDFPHYEIEHQPIPEGFWKENLPCDWWEKADNWTEADWRRAFPGLTDAQMESLQDLPRGKGESMSHAVGMEYLESDVSRAEAKEILQMADFDYCIMALRTAVEILAEENVSAQQITEELHESGYTPEEIAYALEHCGADWKFQAVECLQEALMHDSLSRPGVFRKLMDFEKFTAEEAKYAMEQVGIDYVENARRTAVWLRHKGSSREEILSELEKMGFTEEEALKGVAYRWWKFWER